MRRPFPIIARISDLVHALNSRLLGAGLAAQGVASGLTQKWSGIIAGRCGRGEEGVASSATRPI
jgi:hypothetical protein